MKVQEGRYVAEESGIREAKNRIFLSPRFFGVWIQERL